jgi:hypothetical protein
MPQDNRVRAIELTQNDVGYNGVTKRDVGKIMLVWPNGCTDIISKYEKLLRCNIVAVIVANGGSYSDYRHNADGDFEFYCDVLPHNAQQLFPQATITRRGDYVRTLIIFPKNNRLLVKRTTYKGVKIA